MAKKKKAPIIIVDKAPVLDPTPVGLHPILLPDPVPITQIVYTARDL